eukprot:3679285-Rhodomonas_salina.4
MLSPLSHVESHQPLRGLTRRVAHRRCTLQAVPFATGRRSRSAKEAREAARTALVSVHRFSSQASSCAPTRIPSAQVVRACSVSQQGALDWWDNGKGKANLDLWELGVERRLLGMDGRGGASDARVRLSVCLGCACAVVLDASPLSCLSGARAHHGQSVACRVRGAITSTLHPRAAAVD